jgi:hypothetical protein
MDNLVYQVFYKFLEATMTMWETLKLPQVWRPCFYMYLSLALSLNMKEGMFGTSYLVYRAHPRVFLFLLHYKELSFYLIEIRV